jgi:hypothetical protein
MGQYGFTLKKTPPGVYPLLAIIGAALGGVVYYTTHMIQNPDNVFDKR